LPTVAGRPAGWNPFESTLRRLRTAGIPGPDTFSPSASICVICGQTADRCTALQVCPLIKLFNADGPAWTERPVGFPDCGRPAPGFSRRPRRTSSVIRALPCPFVMDLCDPNPGGRTGRAGASFPRVRVPPSGTGFPAGCR